MSAPKIASTKLSTKPGSIADRLPLPDWFKDYQNVIREAMWTRIRYGPSAIENVEVRRAIVKGEYKLKSVQTRVRQGPIVVERRFGGLLGDISKFDRRTLHHTETKVSRQPVLVQVLSTEMKTAIKSFPQRQLSHVVPRVSHKPIVAEMPISTEILKGITTFPKKQLKHVVPRVSHSPGKPTISASEEKRDSKKQQIQQGQPSVPQLDLKAIVANVELLAAMGFADKKKSFQLLRQTGNNLALAVETLLSE